MRTKIFIAATLLILCSSSACFANPVIPFPSFGGALATNTGYALIIDFVADFTALILAYLVIKKVRTLLHWKFLPYLGLVFLGGIIIDAVSFYVPAAVIGLLSLPAGRLHVLIIFIFVGLLLYFYNSFLSKRFFKLERNQARVIGTVIALLTNPVIGSLLLNSVQRWQY